MIKIDDVTNVFIDYGIDYAYEKDDINLVWHQCKDYLESIIKKIRSECADDAIDYIFNKNNARFISPAQLRTIIMKEDKPCEK